MASTLAKHTTLKRQLIVWFLLIACVPLIILSLVVNWQLEQRLMHQQEVQLYNLAKEKGRLVRQMIIDNQAQLTQFATLPSLTWLLTSNEDSAHVALIDEYSRRIIGLNNFYDLLIVDKQGKVVFSVLHESDFGADLTQPEWKQTVSGRAFDQAQHLMTNVMTSYSYYAPSRKNASFMATPVWNAQGEWLGVVMIQLKDDWLAPVSAGGVGTSETGEIVLAQHDMSGKLVAVSPLRFRPATELAQPLDLSHSVPANFAITGQEGFGDGVDYRNQAVLAGWVFIPSLKMALVIKQDLAEVLESVTQVRWFALLFLLFVVLATALFAYYLSLHFTRPIHTMTNHLRSLMQGMWHLRLPEATQTTTEGQQLAEGINHLAETIEGQVDRLQQQAVELEYQTETLARYNEDLEAAVAERTKELALLSVVDPMTGLYNRRHYAEEGARFWKTVARNQQILMFALLDVDYFKLYNDTQGHQAGDTALTIIARCMQQACRRSGDLAFRMGGEEMAILAVVKDAEDACQMMDHLRMEIEASAIAHPTSLVKPLLTVSIGIALFDGCTCHGPTKPNLDGLYRLADGALYQAKAQGRNQVCLASEVLHC